MSQAQQALGADAAYAANILYRLAAKGWLQHIERDKYRLIPLEAGLEAGWAEHEFRIAATLVAPYYLAYGTALADGFDHPEYCAGVIEAAKGLWYGRDEIDLERLVVYGRRLANLSALKDWGSG